MPIAGHNGLLIVSADEWPTSETGFRETPGSAQQFVQNLALLMAGGRGGRFLIYSNHWTFGEPFQRLLYLLGYQFNVSMTPGSLSAYSGIFVGGTPGVDRAALMTYLQRGGNVYIAGSTGMENEMSFWNAMLKPYGMEYISHPKSGSANEPLQIHTFARTPLFEGVRELQLRGPSPIRVIPGHERQVQVLSEEDGYNWWALAAVARMAGLADVTVPPPAQAAQAGGACSTGRTGIGTRRFPPKAAARGRRRMRMRKTVFIADCAGIWRRLPLPKKVYSSLTTFPKPCTAAIFWAAIRIVARPITGSRTAAGAGLRAKRGNSPTGTGMVSSNPTMESRWAAPKITCSLPGVAAGTTATSKPEPPATWWSSSLRPANKFQD